MKHNMNLVFLAFQSKTLGAIWENGNWPNGKKGVFNQSHEETLVFMYFSGSKKFKLVDHKWGHWWLEKILVSTRTKHLIDLANNLIDLSSNVVCFENFFGCLWVQENLLGVMNGIFNMPVILLGLFKLDNVLVKCPHWQASKSAFSAKKIGGRKF